MKSARRVPALVLGLAALVACGVLGAARHRSTAPPTLSAAPAPSSPEPAPAATSRESSAPSAARATTTAPTSASNREQQRLLLIRHCLALAETDVLAAMETARAQNLCADDPGLLPSLLSRWASEDFDGAHAWLRARESSAWRDDLLARLAHLRAQSDPLAAARLVLADIPPGPIRDEATISVVHQWIRLDHEAARLWAESLPEEPLRLRAMQETELQLRVQN